jgi:hypothetical protein
MGQKNSKAAEPSGSGDDFEDSNDYPYVPNLSDIRTVREDFLQRTPLPLELVDIILDYAEYWASVTFTSDVSVDASGSSSRQDVIILRTIPLGLYYEENVDGSYQVYNSAVSHQETLTWAPPRGENPFRQVEFHIESHDQGWGGGHDPGWGPYDGAYTWFDAYIEHVMIRQPDESLLAIASKDAIPPSGFKWIHAYHTADTSGNIIFSCPGNPTNPELNPPINKPTHLTRNRRADKNTQHHHIVWHYLDNQDFGSYIDDESGTPGRLVRELKVGDTIAVWARARFGGWVNHVKSVSITVSWAA